MTPPREEQQHSDIERICARLEEVEAKVTALQLAEAMRQANRFTRAEMQAVFDLVFRRARDR